MLLALMRAIGVLAIAVGLATALWTEHPKSGAFVAAAMMAAFVVAVASAPQA